MASTTSIALSLEDRELVILGTEYAGEMKKGVFTVMNYFDAEARHPVDALLGDRRQADRDARRCCSACRGTGKTTLSADPKRHLIGDDEHCWSDDGIFNIEGGCYAKAINLTPESEPDIFQALRFGAVLENVVLEEDRTRRLHRHRASPRTRAARYPIEFIRNAKIPCVAGHPTDVIFLTCDAFGVLPPVSALSPAQAMYHFISGYTAKVAGTEVGVTEPQATFSPCFGGPFLVWHPTKYAELLAAKMKQHDARVWLVNTGWSGGAYGVGKRIKLAHTRAIIDAIHTRRAREAPRPSAIRSSASTWSTACPGVPAEILRPRDTWADKAAYDTTAKKLAGLFRENFKKYEAGVSAEIKAAGPA